MILSIDELLEGLYERIKKLKEAKMLLSKSYKRNIEKEISYEEIEEVRIDCIVIKGLKKGVIRSGINEKYSYWEISNNN